MTYSVILQSIFFAEMGQLAAESALRDVGMDYCQVQAVAASYCYGDPTCGEYIVQPMMSSLCLSCADMMCDILCCAITGQKAVYGEFLSSSLVLRCLRAVDCCCSCTCYC